MINFMKHPLSVIIVIIVIIKDFHEGLHNLMTLLTLPVNQTFNAVYSKLFLDV